MLGAGAGVGIGIGTGVPGDPPGIETPGSPPGGALYCAIAALACSANASRPVAIVLDGDIVRPSRFP